MTACVSSPPLDIRPGLTAAQVAQPLRKPVGRTYTWNLILQGASDPLPGRLTLRSSAAGSGNLRLRGQIALTLPPELTLGADANTVARELSIVLTGADTGVSFSNGALNLPAEVVFNARGRALSFRMLGQRARYTPADCFAVIGTCSFTATNDRGQSLKTTVTTTEENGIWRAELRDQRGGRSRQVYTLDQDGVMLDFVSISTDNGRRSVFKWERT